MHEVIGHASGPAVPDGLKGTPQAALKEHFSALEEGARRSGRPLLHRRSQARRARHHPGRRSGRDRPRRIRGLHAQCAGAAAARSRGHADRRRPHAQPPDDHPVADGQHQGDRAAARATARRYLVMVDPKAFRDGVGKLLAEVQRIKSEGDYAAAKTLFETHGIHFDPEAARRDRHARRSAEPAVLHRVRDAEADRRHRSRREDHRRHGVVSAGSDDADAQYAGVKR